MMDPVLGEVFSLVLRVLLLVSAPIVLFVALAGTIVSALQTVTSIQDTALLYAARLIAFLAVLYFLAPAFVNHILILTERVYGIT